MSTYDAETQAFLDEMMPAVVAAERAMRDGDPEPRKEVWSRRDPLTLFGADMDLVTGWDAIGPAFDVVGSWFSGCTAYDVEVVAAGASGDLAYVACFEHTSCRVQGEPRAYRLRVTHVFRREDGRWRFVHRHGDRGVS